MKRWLKGLTITGVVGFASGVVGIVTANYTLPTPRASAYFYIMPNERSINKMVADFQRSDKAKEMRRQCASNPDACSTEALVDHLLGESERFPLEYTDFIIRAENVSGLEVRNFHLSFVARDATGEVLGEDFLKSGSAIRVEGFITGSVPAEEKMYEIDQIDVCISYRGRYHFDVVREKYTVFKQDFRAPEFPNIIVPGFGGRGDMRRSTTFFSEDGHCPQSLIPDSS